MISVFFKKTGSYRPDFKSAILIVIFLLFGRKKGQKKQICEKKKTTDPLIAPFAESEEIHLWKTATSLALSVKTLLSTCAKKNAKLYLLLESRIIILLNYCITYFMR